MICGNSGWCGRSDRHFRYAGQYFDSETNLCYNRYRYYSPETGTYLSQDPIGIWGGYALYAYVRDVNKELDFLGLKPFDIVPYGAKTSPNENHHGILDIWATHNIEGYPSRATHNPTIELTKAQPDATKVAYRDWLEEKTGKRVGGKVDWTKVSPREAYHLSERMFDAAGVPQDARNKYYSEFNKYIYTGCGK